MTGVTRQAFHAEHREQAQAEAARLFAARAERQGAWLNWVAGELYRLRPAEYAAMVRRELAQLQDHATL